MNKQQATQKSLITPSLNFVNAPGSPIAVESRVDSVTLGDVNNDGNLDMVATDYYSNNLSVFLGHGNGTFASQQTFDAGDHPVSVTLGDLNNDGNLDMIAANRGSNNLSVLIGYGDGKFGTQQTFAAGDYPDSLALGDVNKDGNLDIVAAIHFGPLSVWLGYGNGTFAPQQTFAAGDFPVSVVLGDVDNDGNLDMVSASYYLSVLLGYGNGKFAPQQTFAAGNNPVSVTLGDLNNDGNLDMVAANEGSANVSVLLGYGDGKFAPQQTFAAGNNPSSVAVGDLNNDGNLDIVATSFSTFSKDDTFSVLLGYGNGTFAPQQIFAGIGPYSVVPADVNKDGYLDLVIANDGDSSLSVFLNELGFNNSSLTEEKDNNLFFRTEAGLNQIRIINDNNKPIPTDDNSQNASKDAIEASESSAHSIKSAQLPDMTSSFMLGMVLAKMGANAVDSLVAAGKRWWQGKAEEMPANALSTEHQQAQTSFERLQTRINALLSQKNLDTWYRYGLEDLKEELQSADKSRVSLAQVKEWQVELGELEADYALPIQAAKVPAVKQAYSNSFFKPQQPVLMPEPAVLTQAPAQPRIAA